MSKQNTTTKIQFATDFAVTAAGMKLSPDARILMACEVLSKDPAKYMHLDQGRKGMTALNLLRGAARKDPSIVARVESFVTYDIEINGEYSPSRTTGSKKAAPSLPVLAWPKSARFQFAHIENGEWVYTYTRKTDTDATRN